MIFFRKPDQTFIDTYLRGRQRVPLNYEAVGATSTEVFPPEFKVDRHEVQLGWGASSYQKAVVAIQQFRHYEIEWLQLCQPTVPIEEGSHLAILNPGPFDKGYWQQMRGMVNGVVDWSPFLEHRDVLAFPV